MNFNQIQFIIFNHISIYFFVCNFALSYLNEILFYFYKTALHIAVKNGNIEIVKLLLSCEKLKVNILYKIPKFIILITFKFEYLNNILEFIISIELI